SESITGPQLQPATTFLTSLSRPHDHFLHSLGTLPAALQPLWDLAYKACQQLGNVEIGQPARLQAIPEHALPALRAGTVNSSEITILALSPDSFNTLLAKVPVNYSSM